MLKSLYVEWQQRIEKERGEILLSLAVARSWLADPSVTQPDIKPSRNPADVIAKLLDQVFEQDRGPLITVLALYVFVCVSNYVHD